MRKPKKKIARAKPGARARAPRKPRRGPLRWLEDEVPYRCRAGAGR